MSLNKDKLYLLIITACLAGFFWLGLSYQASLSATNDHAFGVCLIKRITDIPCPSCGTTRSIHAILTGDFSAAFYWNPFGLIVFIIMVIAPFWIGIDWLFKKSSFYLVYQKIEQFFSRKKVAIIAVFIVLLNWIWNIQKGL